MTQQKFSEFVYKHIRKWADRKFESGPNAITAGLIEEIVNEAVDYILINFYLKDKNARH